MTSTTPPPPAAPDFPPSAPWVRPDRWRFAPTTGLVAAVFVGGLGFDIGIRHPVGFISFLVVAATITAALVGGWVRGPRARRLATLALLPAGLLMLRDSSWLIPLNLVATLTLLLLAAAVRPEPHAVSRAFGRLLRPVSAFEPIFFSLDLVGASAANAVRGRDALGRRLLRLATGLALALPVILILAGLLAAADAVFRSWLAIPLDVPALVEHALFVSVGAMLMSFYAAHGAWKNTAAPSRTPGLVGPTEASIVLAGVVAVYAAFVVAQIIAIASGAGYVERTTGLTYAEYARQGFFQLVAAAVITLLVLATLHRFRRSASPRIARRLGRLEQATVALTLVVVAVAIRRLFLYEAEFGLTMLRFSTIIFAGFIGFVFVVTGLWLSDRLHRSPVAVVLAGALVLLVAVNIANPEALVAQRNIDRFGGTDELDINYLVTQLGPDAYPTIASDPAAREVFCLRDRPVDDRLLTFNLGRQQAADICGS
ncbi:MAG: two-component system sensor histidine kinase BaeS [Candidatus Aldehydirespiratoraceae bacterium]|jgi:two-component system sensor histidine kinase BaeS